MKASDNQRGRMSEHFRGAGTSDGAMVERRAREIAVINGRPASQFTQGDWDQAKLELTGGSAASDIGEESGSIRASVWNPAPGTGGHQIRPRPVSDEQTVAEELVREGVEEATHEQMLEGSRTSREEDQI